MMMNMQWKEENNALNTNLSFSSFKEALAFVNQVGELAEKHAHHPDICIKKLQYC